MTRPQEFLVLKLVPILIIPFMILLGLDSSEQSTFKFTIITNVAASELANRQLGKLARMDNSNEISLQTRTNESQPPIVNTDDTDKGKRIMEAVYKQARKHKLQEFDMTMSIFNQNNKKRERYFTLKKAHEEFMTKSLIKFYKPSYIKGTKLLTHASEDGNKIFQWIYIPAFKSVKQIKQNEKNSSFMGSDFSYSDIAGRQVDQDKHKLIKEDGNYYFITSTPVNLTGPYIKINFIIYKKYLVPAKIDFYNKENFKFKSLINKSISQFDGMYLAIRSVMYNYETNGKTSIDINNVALDSHIELDELDIKSLL